MTVEISITHAQAAVDEALLVRAIETVLASEGVSRPAEVSVLISDDLQLQELNRLYRGIDTSTDVLSFPGDDPDELAADAVDADAQLEDEPLSEDAEEADEAPANREFVRAPGSQPYLGDIAISWDRVLAQAAEYGHSVERELIYLVVHGTLHLLGYDHEQGPEEEQAMRAREELVLATLNLSR